MAMSCVGLRARPYGHIIRIVDMPAHLKSSLLGASVSISLSQGALNLGTWQGIYLGEHRNHGGARTLVATLQGEVEG